MEKNCLNYILTYQFWDQNKISFEIRIASLDSESLPRYVIEILYFPVTLLSSCGIDPL